jgi:hypothetical protein
MPILPSTLEYSSESLIKKSDLIIKDIKKFLDLTKNDIIELHIDLVYPQFAKDRGVMSSVNMTTNFKIIEKLNKMVKLTIHFMGELEDCEIFKSELDKIKFPKNWKIELYTPLSFDINHKGINEYKWIDADQYDRIPTLKNKKFLLMTVKAGKSGQKLTEDIKKQALNLVKEYGKENVIVDGGWGIKDCKYGLRMVSYSSFWNSFISS